MKMSNNITAVRMCQAFGRRQWILKSARVSAGILLSASFLHQGESLGATLPGLYNVNLTWNSSTSADVTGYRVHYGTASGIYTESIVFGNVTAASIPGLASGVTYYFAVTAIGSEALESGFSNQTSFLPGLDGTRIRTTQGGAMVLTITGLIGQSYDIEATQDLKVWTIISRVTPGDGGSLEFTDPNAANHSKRFYRTRKTP